MPRRRGKRTESVNKVALAKTIDDRLRNLDLGNQRLGDAGGQRRGLSRRHQPPLQAIAQQPDEANTLTRTLFVGLAMVESTAIYCFVIALILIFANPFWGFVTAGG